MEMDCATEPLPKPSNISNMVSKFSKICKLRSIGVFSSENNSNITEDSSEATEEMECAGKVHPFLVENQSKTNQCDEMDLSKLFDIISAMKLAYIQLQEAHIPYNVEKITGANELVVAKFRELYNIKQSYKEKKLKDMNSVYLSNSLVDEIRVQEKLLEKIRFQVKAKNTEVLDLHKKLGALNLLNTQMDEKLKKKVNENIEILEMSSSSDVIAAAASRAFHDFAKSLISMMKTSGWDLDQAANSVESSVFYSKRSHKKFTFEAYVAIKMFNGISSHPCNIDCVTRYNDPMDALIENPNSNFAKFCRTKYLNLIHPLMEASFFGNLDHRTFVFSGKHPRTPFYQGFVKMAWRVWVLQGIIFSSEKKVEIFGVKRGTEFSEAYMKSVVDLNEEMIDPNEMSRFKVEFMVIPGFKIGNMLVKSQVYLSSLVV